MKTDFYLKSFQSKVQLLTQETKNNFFTQSEELLNWKERPDVWSVLECFEHLNRYSEYYLPAIQKAIEAGTFDLMNEHRDFTHTWIGRLSIKAMSPDNVKKQKTFKRMNPVFGSTSRNVLGRFIRHQETLEKLIDSAQEVNVVRTTIPVEFFKLLKMNVGEAFEFVIVHEQRHVIQALNTLAKAKSHFNEPALKV